MKRGEKDSIDLVTTSDCSIGIGHEKVVSCHSYTHTPWDSRINFESIFRQAFLFMAAIQCLNLTV